MNQGPVRPKRRQLVLKDRPWYQRNPRLFFGVFTTSCLLIFYSRPLYDIFIREPAPPGTVPQQR